MAERVAQIVAVLNPFQVVGAVIGFVAVFMINFVGLVWTRNEGDSNESMHGGISGDAITREFDSEIAMSQEGRLKKHADAGALRRLQASDSTFGRHLVNAFVGRAWEPRFHEGKYT